MTQPRQPCYKLAYKFGRQDMIKRFAKSGGQGFYLRVAKEGDVGAGDSKEFLSRQESAPTVTDMLR